MRLVMPSGVFGLKPSKFVQASTHAFTRQKLQQSCARLFFTFCTSLLNNNNTHIHLLLLLTLLSAPLDPVYIARGITTPASIKVTTTAKMTSNKRLMKVGGRRHTYCRCTTDKPAGARRDHQQSTARMHHHSTE